METTNRERGQKYYGTFAGSIRTCFLVVTRTSSRGLVGLILTLTGMEEPWTVAP